MVLEMEAVFAMNAKKRRRAKKDLSGIVVLIAVCCGGYYYLLNMDKYYSPWVSFFIGAGIILFPFIIKKLVKIVRRRKYIKSSLSQIDKMDGHEFERYLKEMYSSKGYKVQLVGEDGKDFGADLIISGGKDKLPRIVVQAKRYTIKNKVGIKAIQEVFSAKEFYDCDKAAVITSGYYTSAAVKLAKKCNITLLDRNDLYNDNWRLY